MLSVFRPASLRRAFARHYLPCASTTQSRFSAPMTLSLPFIGVGGEIPDAFSGLWVSLSFLPTADPMVPVLVLASLQALLGGFDNIYHHELLLRLPW